MQTEPQQEHLWLQRLVGNWTYESEASIGPDQPPIKTSGVEQFKSLGGLWYVGEGGGKMPDGNDCTMIISIGYNSETKRYQGTWIGSMMPKLWIYDGFVEGNTLNLDAKGPSMAGDGKIVTYRDSIEFIDDDHRIFRSQTQGEDGAWTLFMTAHYNRVVPA